MSKDADDKPIPNLFATIHWRSDERPDGYTPADVSWMNVIANRHIPELHGQLLAEHQLAFPDHVPSDEP
jgi:hypothetical protein